MKLQLKQSFMQINQSLDSNCNLLREVTATKIGPCFHEKLLGSLPTLSAFEILGMNSDGIRTQSEIDGSADEILQQHKLGVQSESMQPRVSDSRRDLARTLLSLNEPTSSTQPPCSLHTTGHYHIGTPSNSHGSQPRSSHPQPSYSTGNGYYPSVFVNQTAHNTNGGVHYATVASAGSGLQSHYSMLKGMQGISDYNSSLNIPSYQATGISYQPPGSSYMLVPGMALALLPQANNRDVNDHGLFNGSRRVLNEMPWPTTGYDHPMCFNPINDTQHYHNEGANAVHTNWSSEETKRSAEKDVISSYLASLGLYSERDYKHATTSPTTTDVTNDGHGNVIRKSEDVITNPMQCLGEAAVRILKDEQQQRNTSAWQTNKVKLQPLATPPANQGKRKSKHDKVCTVCGKGYARTFTLRNHMRTHTGEKPYSCRVCQRTFNQLGTMEIHMRTHTGERPYHCAQCQKRFGHSYALKTHMRTHTGEKPYSCQVCSKSFADGSTLYKHKRTHNGEKPFACKFCHRKFSQSGNMHRHMSKTHTNEAQAC